MNKTQLLTAICCVACVTFSWMIASTVSAQRQKPKTIKEVMKLAPKDGRLKKVLGGKASVKEKQTLALLYVDLSKNKPKKGSADSWKKLTGALVNSSVAYAKGNKSALAALKKASNCKACHNKHK